MKINISELMNLIAEEERRVNNLFTSLKTNIYSTSGNIYIIDDYKKLI